MGNVLAFSPRPAGPKSSPAGGPAAAVIIFPGVRYERMEERNGRTDICAAQAKAKLKRRDRPQH